MTEEFLLSLLTGIIAGLLSGVIIKKRPFGLVGNIVLGIFGSLLVGGLLFDLIGLSLILSAYGLIGSLIRSIIGAIILLFLVGLIKEKLSESKSGKTRSLISEQNNQSLNKTTVHTTNTASLYDRKQRGWQNTNKIFISYRRRDSADVVGRIYDRLTLHFSKEKVFKDVDAMPLGVDFRQYVDEIVGNCDILIAVIGDQWLNMEGPTGKRRLDDPRDLVRIEVESALKRGIPVIPVLVQDATMPSEDDLPVSLKGLVYRNGIPVRWDPDFHKDVDRLISGMEAHLTK